MNVMEKIAEVKIVPVVVLERAEDAVSTANALLEGGVDVMEITFRTKAAAAAIEEVIKNCPDMCVGAGTVITLDQCKQAIDLGVKFIVSPGFDEEVVSYCIKNNIAVLPGCVTPTEIMAAMRLGIKVFKYFPADVYGGINAMKALCAPFTDITFIPTGGVNGSNLKEFISESFIYAVGGSWVCKKNDISEGKYDHITKLCKEARQIAIG